MWLSFEIPEKQNVIILYSVRSLIHFYIIMDKSSSCRLHYGPLFKNQI